MLVCALPQFASLATITHLETHREMSCRFGETRIFSTVTTSANCIYRLLLNHRAKMEISLTLFEKKGGGNRRGGKIAPLTPAPPPRFEGRSSFAKWRVPLLRPFVSVASFFRRRRWRQFSKLEAVIAPYFIASSKQRLRHGRRQHELRGPFLAGIIINNGRPNRALCYTTAFFLPSFLPLRSYKMPHHQRGFAIRQWSASAWEVFI